MPVLGALFRSRDYQNNESELVIIISAYLVEPTVASNFAAPTDGYVSPTDAETLLLGKLNATYDKPGTGAHPAPSSSVGFIVQ
jgi:pilus assembly protein CpaC